LREIYETKKKYPNHAIVVSLMVETKEEWREIIKQSVGAGADGIELNFGCPHGMCERGMGSAVGQEPKINERITGWAVKYSTVPVLVKLTPNVGSILPHGLAAKRGGAHGVSLINTIKSIIGVDIDNFIPEPRVGKLSSNGGYCGQAVKPIALHMVAQLAREPDFGIPISGIGGVANWRDAVEFLLLGSNSVQVCTEVMLRGYRIVEDMIEGLSGYMSEHGMSKLDHLVGKAIPSYAEWGDLDMNYETIAKIDADKCIGCHLCVVACHDGAHQCIDAQPNTHVPLVDESECVGCNLCQIVCPVPDCITMVTVDNGYKPASWNDHITGLKTLRPKKGAH
jgi:dihydropyrimidine dehydrogenase (NAD+) subunit PreA